METRYYNPIIGSDLMESCVYATTFARLHNCIVQMNWCDVQYSCNPNMTARNLYELINFNLKRP